MPSLDQWIQIAQTLGVAVACLIALALAVWASLRWIANNVILKLVERALKYFDDRTKLDVQMAESVNNMSQHNAAMAESVHGLIVGMGEMKNLIINTNKTTILSPKS